MLKDLVNSVTTVHGLSYLDHRGKSERIFWLLCIVASFSFATYVIVGNVVQWENEPSSVVSVQPVLARSEINFSLKMLSRNWLFRRVSTLVLSHIVTYPGRIPTTIMCKDKTPWIPPPMSYYS